MRKLKNFFDKPEEDRYRYLKESIIKKMDLLEEVVKRRKLDTNMEKLKADFGKDPEIKCLKRQAKSLAFINFIVQNQVV